VEEEKRKKKEEINEKKNCLTKVCPNKRTNDYRRNYIHTPGSNNKRQIERRTEE
jgi:hypothetical protein